MVSLRPPLRVNTTDATLLEESRNSASATSSTGVSASTPTSVLAARSMAQEPDNLKRPVTPVLSSSEDGDCIDSDEESMPTATKSIDAQTYLHSLNQSRTHSRNGSTFSLSRHTLSGQMKQLRQTRLPSADDLAGMITSFESAPNAADALEATGNQLRSWLRLVSDVLKLLDTEDDADWAIDGGRVGLIEVETAVNQFEALVGSFVNSIESVQSRADVADLPSDRLSDLVDSMERMLSEWEQVRMTLQELRRQVELAMEWRELWNSVLGDIGIEMANLNILIAEMDAARDREAQRVLNHAELADSSQTLGTITEEEPSQSRSTQPAGPPHSQTNHPSSLLTPISPTGNSETAIPQDDSRLLALFARMQPLRASLDFLPMTVSNFRLRAGKIFPSACLEIDEQKVELEGQWDGLNQDAQRLREELGEDRWIHVFRNAGRQAKKLCESVHRTIDKLLEALNLHTDPTQLMLIYKKKDAYETKKSHYCPAILKVLGIIEKGINDRQTVNHDILRVQQECKDLWQQLQDRMQELDVKLDTLQLPSPPRSQKEPNQPQLRDSISSMISADQSTVTTATTTTSQADSPRSSPASSIVAPSTVVKRDSLEARTSSISAAHRESQSRLSSHAVPQSRHPPKPLTTPLKVAGRLRSEAPSTSTSKVGTLPQPRTLPTRSLASPSNAQRTMRPPSASKLRSPAPSTPSMRFKGRPASGPVPAAAPKPQTTEQFRPMINELRKPLSGTGLDKSPVKSVTNRGPPSTSRMHVNARNTTATPVSLSRPSSRFGMSQASPSSRQPQTQSPARRPSDYSSSHQIPGRPAGRASSVDIHASVSSITRSALTGVKTPSPPPPLQPLHSFSNSHSAYSISRSQQTARFDNTFETPKRSTQSLLPSPQISPSSVARIRRPASSLSSVSTSMSGTTRRSSMLPVPVGMGSSTPSRAVSRSGRDSALGASIPYRGRMSSLEIQ